jgi:very-short-patch-repair endonuclease
LRAKLDVMADVHAVTHRIDEQSHAGDHELALLAARQHGVVAVWQLRECGVGRGALERRLALGRLHRVHRGVYAVGHRKLQWRGVMMAAVLACGPDAVLSHRSAARLSGVRPDSRRGVDVTVAGSGRRGRPGIDLHAVRALDPRDITRIDGIPVTTLPRTLLDLAEVVPQDHVVRTIEEAERKRIFNRTALEELLARSPGRRGRRPLRSILTDAVIEPGTREELERRFRQVIREAGLPHPKINTLVEDYEVDAYWPDHKLVVELDGYDTHQTRKAFEDDRERDAVLLLAGYRVVRITWRQLIRKPDEVINRLRRLLR